MRPTEDKASTYLEQRTLVFLVLAVSIALGWILQPYYSAILWGFIFALLFTPLHRWLLPRLSHRRTPAALLTMLIVLVVVGVPLLFVALSLVREATDIYQGLQSGALNPVLYLHRVFDALPDGILAVLKRFGLYNFDALQYRVTTTMAQASQYFATQALSMGQNTFEFASSIFIALYLAFFLIRDGDLVAKAMAQAIPLAPAHKRELRNKFTTVIRATVKGNLLVAIIQGTLGGLAFAVLGLGAAVLWGVVMVFASLIPAVGAGLVWVPVAIYFAVSGVLWKAVALTLWGVLVIGLVDNLLRPMLVGKDTRMPDYVVLITTLGGIAVMGINGFVVGPTIAAMFIAVWHLYETTQHTGTKQP